MSSGVLIVDDHPVVRRGIRSILEDSGEFAVVAEASDGEEGVRMAMSDGVEIAVLDVSMPAMTGLEAARHISERRPELPVLILSMHENEQFFFQALRAGACGYVLKSAVDRDLVSALRAGLAGESFIYPGAARALMRAYAESSEASSDSISPREAEVLKLIAEGNTTREIAEALVISEKTVDSHRTNLLAKLGLRNRIELTRYAIRCGLIAP